VKKLDIKVLTTIGTIMLIAILFVAVLSYSNISGFAPLITQIKQGVDRLVGWFIPPKYNLTLEAVANNVTVSGRVFKLDKVEATGVTTIGYIHLELGAATMNVRLAVVSDLPISLTLVSKNNCTVTITGNEIAVYPTGAGNAKVKIAVKITSAEPVSGEIAVTDIRY